MKKLIYRKIYFLFVGIILLTSISGLSAKAATIEPEIKLIKIFKGSDIPQFHIQTKINTDMGTMPELMEFVCVYDVNNQLKYTAIINNVTSDLIEAKFIGDIQLSEDNIRLYVWDNDMKPYGCSDYTSVKNVKRVFTDGRTSPSGR